MLISAFTSIAGVHQQLVPARSRGRHGRSHVFRSWISKRRPAAELELLHNVVLSFA
jgi:hypothetical protein